MSEAALARIRALVEAHGNDLPLDLAMAAVARVENPKLEESLIVEALDGLAVEVRDHGVDPSDGGLEALQTILFEHRGFVGNREKYYQPENSLIDQVLRRRKGIPITLAVLWLETARRLELSAEGVGFPGHFLVRHRAGEVLRYVDVFDGGRVLSATDTQQILSTIHGPRARLETAMLEAVSNLALMVRVVHNLKNAYAMAQDHLGVVSAIDRLLALDPELHTERRDRGLVYARLGLAASAAQDLRTFLSRVELGTVEREALERMVVELEARATMMN